MRATGRATTDPAAQDKSKPTNRRYPVKTWLSLAGGAVLALSAANASAQDMLRIGTEGAYPPWNYTEANGELAGFEVDLGNAMCEKMNVTCEFVAQDWDGIIPALMNGRYDAIMAGMSITDERRERISFSTGYVTDPAYFLAPKSSPLQDAETLDQVKAAIDGMTVGVQGSTIHQNFIDEYLAGMVDLKLYDTQENMELDLTAGRIDAALADYAAWRAFFEKSDGAEFDIFGPKLTGSDYPVFGEGVGVGLRQEDDELLEKINAALAALKEDGTITVLSNQYFGYDITMF
ncbi:MAG: transporter substrate-binding domain-containing protein [Inquilinus sp.]|nr:transporter substrate-binding domain-containing protein [Inquilinus sp.]